ncbi:hypothetical protein ACJX0J_009608, partial [Zea mays]
GFTTPGHQFIISELINFISSNMLLFLHSEKNFDLSLAHPLYLSVVLVGAHLLFCLRLDDWKPREDKRLFCETSMEL